MNRLISQPEGHPLPPLDGARHSFVRVGDLRMHVAELGPEDGAPVLLVHGWPQHWWCWRKVAPELTTTRCIMPDLRGHGWSTAPAKGYEKAQLADDLRCLLDVLELERVCYVGHDWGAIAGFVLALEDPRRISALLALSVPHPWPSWHDRLNPLRLAAGLYQVPLAAPLIGPALMRMGLTRRILRKAMPEHALSAEEAEVYDARLSSSDGVRTTTKMYRTFLLREFLGALGGEDRFLVVPARLVVGERDPIIRGADLGGHEAHARELTVDWVPGAGHFLPEERPDLVARHIRDLCTGGDATSPRASAT